MSKKLIEQLHPVGFATQAKRIEELERANQHLIMALADTEALEIGTAEQRDALQADNARLRGYLTRILEYWTQDGNNQELFDMLCHIEETVKAELAATPEQSLTEYRNKVIEECAAKLDSCVPIWANEMRAMKEQP